LLCCASLLVTRFAAPLLLLPPIICSADRAFLRKWKWSQMLLDEAHALKNAASQRSRRLRKLAGGCRGRVMLTGTPLQNDLGELHNLLSFLLPTLFKEADESAEGGFGERAFFCCADTA
jgi:SWI/SNF-related matrix-associated actin-dependent regulator 1 of chromatin subfamily A